MNLKIVKVLRAGKRTCKKHSWRIGTEWKQGEKHCFIRICACGEVQECREFGKMKKKKIYFTSSEATELLGLTKRWLFQLEKDGKLPRAKRDSNNFRYYTESDIRKIRGRRKKK